MRQRRRKTIRCCQGRVPHFLSAHVTIPSKKLTVQNPSKRHKSFVPGTVQWAPRAGHCSTTHLQLHGAHFCSTTPLASLCELCAGRLCTRHGSTPKRLSRTNSWEANAPRKPTGLQEYHTFKTDTECPRFHNELLAPLKQLCLKIFSTACHHRQRFRFDLKLFHSLDRNLMMQNPAAGFSGWFSSLNYKCPDSTETVPACLRD